VDASLLDEFDPNKEIQDVIKDLEEEYKLLNRKYHDTLTRMSEQVATSNVDNITAHLKSLVEQMERKSKQMAYLKRYQGAVVDQLREAISPPRIRGALKRIKTLKLFRDLKTLQGQYSA